jgi:hypothetical protein
MVVGGGVDLVTPTRRILCLNTSGLFMVANVNRKLLINGLINELYIYAISPPVNFAH